MENLIELVMQYQKTNAETTLKTILQRLYPMMRKQLKKVNLTFQEDLLQEMIIFTYLTIQKFKIDLEKSTLEINQKQFLKFLKISYTKVIPQFYQKHKNSFQYEISDRLFDFSCYPIESSFHLSLEEILLEHHVTPQEIQFLTTFIDKNQLLTQKEVAQKLGYSQQKVSRILNQIKQKYKNKKICE